MKQTITIPISMGEYITFADEPKVRYKVVSAYISEAGVNRFFAQSFDGERRTFRPRAVQLGEVLDKHGKPFTEQIKDAPRGAANLR